ncbi:MAG: hypothetical protein JST12_03005 [Armatimonadetes bacterium]|nr:hypothetical protein [Armatimonadota bacterium]MBS1728912.1 hypothetical protein [Armatimonadota bacterium]
MNIDNPTVRQTIYRCVGLLIIAAGCKAGTQITDIKQLNDEQYLQKMEQLSKQYEDIESKGQAEIQKIGQSGGADELLKAMRDLYDKKSQYVDSLKAIQPPDKFKEFQNLMVEWRTQEHDNEGQVLDGMAQYQKNQSAEIEARVNKLVSANEAIGKTYEAKLLEYAKKSGFQSIADFLSQKVGVAPTTPASNEAKNKP